MERSLSRALNPEVLSCAITLIFRGNSTSSIRGVLEGVFEQMLTDWFGFFLFGMAIFFILLGLWAWNEASEAEDEGEPVELHSLGQTTYRDPWLHKLGAVFCFIFGAATIVLGILILLR